MRMLGESAGQPGLSPVGRELASAIAAGLPFVVVSDGEDVTAVIGDPGDRAADVVKTARRFVPVLS